MRQHLAGEPLLDAVDTSFDWVVNSGTEAPQQTRKRKRIRFGVPSAPVLEAYSFMKQSFGVELDLLYGAAVWVGLLEALKGSAGGGQRANKYVFDDRTILYLHTGGLEEGLESMLARYRAAGFCSPGPAA